jgi:hypothetical protein
MKVKKVNFDILNQEEIGWNLVFQLSLLREKLSMQSDQSILPS